MLSFVVKFSVSALIVYSLIHFKKLDPQAVWQALTDLKLAVVLLLLGVVFSLLKACRLLVILKSTGFVVRLPFCAKVIFSSYYFDLFGIGQTGGLLSRFYYVMKASSEKKTVIAGVLLGEILIGTYTIFFFASLMLLWMGRENDVSRALFGISAAITLIVPGLFALRGYFRIRLPGAVEAGLEGFRRLIRSPKILGIVVTFTFLEYCLKAFSLYMVALAFQPPVPTGFPQIGVIFSLGALVSVLPIGIAGAGPGHLGYQVLWENLSGSESSFGSDLFSMFWYQNLMLAAIGMLAVLFDRPGRRPN